jgi:hypothetical protein
MQVNIRPALHLLPERLICGSMVGVGFMVMVTMVKHRA